MNARQIVFAHTVEAFFVRTYGDRLKPELRAQLEKKGLLGSKLPVDVEVFREGMELVRAALFPEAPVEDAYRAMGEEYLARYFSTVMGGLAAMMVKLLPPEKAIARVSSSLQSASNLVKADYEKRGERDYLVTVENYSSTPGFVAGLLVAFMRNAGGKNVKADLVSHEGRTAKFHVSWE